MECNLSNVCTSLVHNNSIIYISFNEIRYSARSHGLDTTNDIDFFFLLLFISEYSGNLIFAYQWRPSWIFH